MYALAIFLPLIGADSCRVLRPLAHDRGSQIVTCGACCVGRIACVILAEVALGDAPRTIELFSWINSGTFEVNWTLRFDTLTAVMVFVVTVVSSMVHVYSVGYMSHDPHIPRFMAYLGFFTFFMLMLVTADNLLQMFFGWEGVGLCSYLLIGFWYENRKRMQRRSRHLSSTVWATSASRSGLWAYSCCSIRSASRRSSRRAPARRRPPSISSAMRCTQ